MTNRLKNVFKRVFQLNTVADDISQSNCEKWNSMGLLNLVVELETEFDISFEPEEIAAMKDFEIVRKMIEMKVQ